jgi:two-component system LytT family response regulator
MSSKPQKLFKAKIIPMPGSKMAQSMLSGIIAIPSNGQIDVIHTADILYFKSESNYTHIYLEDGSHLIACITLKMFDEHLKGGDFIRIHNQ